MTDTFDQLKNMLETVARALGEDMLGKVCIFKIAQIAIENGSV